MKIPFPQPYKAERKEGGRIIDCFARPLFMPDDLVVVMNLDSDEAGDYRVMKHSEAVGNPNWSIMYDMVPSDLD